MRRSSRHDRSARAQGLLDLARPPKTQFEELDFTRLGQDVIDLLSRDCPSTATVGWACGVGAMLEAAMGTGVFARVSLYLYTGPFGSRTRFDAVLRFRLPIDVEPEPALSRLLRRHCRQRHLLSTAELEAGTQREHVYQVKFFADRDRVDLLESLRTDLEARETRLMLQDAASEY